MSVMTIVNPFRSVERRRQFEAMVKDYEARNSALFHKNGRENQANNIGNAFWRGLHGQEAHWIDSQTPLHVAYVAGREVGRALERAKTQVAGAIKPVREASQPAQGHDGRKWRTVPTAVKCKHCGATPIAARSISGWSLACPNDTKHGYLFEQWMQKCKRKWNALHAPDPVAASEHNDKTKTE